MNRDFVDCSEMIMNTYSGIEKSTLERNNKFYAVWKTVVTKISKYNDKEFGTKLYDHSSIVDVKNGTLLVETDHPGWSQMMQLYTKFILKGLNMYIPEMNINSIAFRVKGSNATLVNVNYEEHFKKSSEEMNKKIEKEEIALKKYEKVDDKENTLDNELPESLKLMFDSMKQSRLTKD